MKLINKFLLVFVSVLSIASFLGAMDGEFGPPALPLTQGAAQPEPPQPPRAPGRSSRPPVHPVYSSPSEDAFGEGPGIRLCRTASGRSVPALDSHSWLLRRGVALFAVSSSAAAPSSVKLIGNSAVLDCFHRFLARLGSAFHVVACADRFEFDRSSFVEPLVPLDVYVNGLLNPTISTHPGLSCDDINKIFDVYIREAFESEILMIPREILPERAEPPHSAAPSRSVCATVLQTPPSSPAVEAKALPVTFTTPLKRVVAQLRLDEVMLRFICHVLRAPRGSVDVQLRAFIEKFFSLQPSAPGVLVPAEIPGISTNKGVLVDWIIFWLKYVMDAQEREFTAKTAFLRESVERCFITLAPSIAEKFTMVPRVISHVTAFLDQSLPIMLRLSGVPALGSCYEDIALGIVKYYFLCVAHNILNEQKELAEACKATKPAFAKSVHQKIEALVPYEHRFNGKKEEFMRKLSVVGLDSLAHFQADDTARLEAQVRHLIFTLHCYRSTMPELLLAAQNDRYYRDAIRLYKLVNDSIIAALNELKTCDLTRGLMLTALGTGSSAVTPASEVSSDLLVNQTRCGELRTSLFAAYNIIRRHIHVMGPVSMRPVAVRVHGPGQLQVFSYVYKNLLLLAKAIEIQLNLTDDLLDFDHMIFIKDYHAYQVTNEPGCSEPSGGHFSLGASLRDLPCPVYRAIDLFELGDEVLSAVMVQRPRIVDFRAAPTPPTSGVVSGVWLIEDEATPGRVREKSSTLFSECYRDHYFDYVRQLVQSVNDPAFAHEANLVAYVAPGAGVFRGSVCLSKLEGALSPVHGNEKLLLRHSHDLGCGVGFTCPVPRRAPMWTMMYRHVDRFVIDGKPVNVTAIHSAFPLLIDESTEAFTGTGEAFAGLHGVSDCELIRRDADHYEKRNK